MADEITPIEEGTDPTSPSAEDGGSTAQTGSADQSGSERTYTQAEVDELTSRMFSQEQLNKMLASERKKVRSKFGDYDDLKARAEAHADYDDVVAERDRLRAESEHNAMVGRVAQATGVPASVVSMLKGGTEEELTEQARAMLGAMPAYPPIIDGGEQAPTGMTLDEIRQIKNPTERVRARAEYMRNHPNS